MAVAAHAAGIRTDESTYTALIVAYGRRKQLVRMKATKQALLKAMGDTPFSTETYAALVQAYGRSRSFHMIDSTIAEMQAKGVKPSLAVYNALIVAYGRGNKADLAVRKPPQQTLARSALSDGSADVAPTV